MEEDTRYTAQTSWSCLHSRYFLYIHFIYGFPIGMKSAILYFSKAMKSSPRNVVGCLFSWRCIYLQAVYHLYLVHFLLIKHYVHLRATICKLQTINRTLWGRNLIFTISLQSRNQIGRYITIAIYFTLTFSKKVSQTNLICFWYGRFIETFFDAVILN